MILQSRILFKSLAASVVMSVVCILMVSLSDTADARGNGGGRSGFSRSSPASSGSLSSRPAVAERQQRGADIQPRVTRKNNNAGDAVAPRSAQSASGVSSDGGAQSAGGVKPAGGAGQPGTAGNPDPVSAQEMAAYRQQFNEQNKDNSRDDDKDRDNWDAPLRPVDPDYSVPVRPIAPDSDDEPRSPVVPAVVAGTVIARNRADDYVDYANTVDDPAYLTEMPCTIEAAMQLDNVTYYRCEKAWYKRGYQSGSVVYIQTDAPPGY